MPGHSERRAWLGLGGNIGDPVRAMATALDQDSIVGTVDYGIAFGVVEKIVTGKRHFLIESLALAVAKALIARFPQIRRAEITVRKPNAPVRGVLDHVEVTVVWPS